MVCLNGCRRVLFSAALCSLLKNERIVTIKDEAKVSAGICSKARENSRRERFKEHGRSESVTLLQRQ